jgi:hypothetical protein
VSSATFSPCGRYRYDLTRTWGTGNRIAVWCGLNPSTADAVKPDPTVTREVNFSKDWGYDGYAKVNAYAFRSTDPKAMLRQNDPCGEDNLGHILRWAKAGAIFIACWGNNIRPAQASTLRLAMYLNGIEVHALKLTKQGHPQHPLYLSATTKPFVWLRGGE